MKTMGKFRILLVSLFVCVLLAGCAARPALIAKSATVPAGVDFSGQWTLRDAPGARALPRARDDLGIRIPPERSTARNAGRRSARRSSGSSVHVFLETGESLKISQTSHGLFISFDRAIVEEYTFGENRVVSVGPIEAQRVSGWQGSVFVVETLDDRGAILTESWQLGEGGDILVRDISIAKGEQREFSSRQRFDRS